jgi:hypothetical protein
MIGYDRLNDIRSLDYLLGRLSGEPICDTSMTPEERIYYLSKEKRFMESARNIEPEDEITGYLEYDLKTGELNYIDKI